MKRPIPKTARMKIAIQSLRELGEFGAEIAGDVAIGSVMRLKSAHAGQRQFAAGRQFGGPSEAVAKTGTTTAGANRCLAVWSMIEQRISQIVPNTIAASTSLR